MSPKELMQQTPERSLDMLRRCIDELDPPAGGVITIDVANFFAGDASLSYRSGFAHGWAINKIAAERQLTTFAVMHGGKQRMGQQYFRLTDRTIAGTGFMGTAEGFAYIATREETLVLDDPDVLDLQPDKNLQAFEWEPRGGGTERFIFGREQPSGLFTFLKGPSDIPKKRIEPTVQVRLDEIVAYMPKSGEIDGAQLRIDLGIAKATFSRDINTLIDLGQIRAVRRGRNVFYCLLHGQVGA
jgi:hypothetical protein